MLPKRWRLKEFFYIVAALVALIGISATITLVPVSSQTTAAATFRSESLNGKQDGIFYLGYIFGIDIPARTFDVYWLVGACGKLLWQSSVTYDLSRSACGLPNIPLDIYISGKLVYSYDPKNFYSLDPFSNKTTGEIGIMSTHRIDIATAELSTRRIFDQLFWFPFDYYHSTSDFFVINPSDNTSLPIIRAVFVDPVNNFAPESVEQATQSVVNGTLLIQSRKTVVGFRRTVNAKMYTFLLFIVNWALTLLVVYITMLVFAGEKLGEGIVVLPLTIILTMPTIRGLFVENPPFGILLDNLGLVLQMIIVSLCSVLILIPSVAAKAASYKQVPTKEC